MRFIARDETVLYVLRTALERGSRPELIDRLHQRVTDPFSRAVAESMIWQYQEKSVD